MEVQNWRADSLVHRVDSLYEFDREPVSRNRLEPGRHFAALFAGEHVAGTEFVIGALFVSWGATTRDILLGLLLGNLLAVLSWTFVCAPIAVATRLTLYWYLRRIAGPGVTALYNVLNAVLFCVLAGAMITVSASAVRIPFGIPPQTGWYPKDPRFVLVVLAVGSVTVFLAILGFKSLAKFSGICSPWIFCMFFAGALAALPVLAADTPSVGAVRNVGDFLRLANERIWTGDAQNRATTIGFWHVTAFAWICNLAMHVGLSDMALLRYAKNSWYGLHSAFGMYLGHYLAWVCAGIMGASAARWLEQPLPELDAGAVAYQCLGVSGAVAVILAGWTTSNPTLYRAGLALQAITPNWPRWLVTLIAGIATTAIACSPFVFQWLLQFVAVYGLLLMPVGTIVFVEHWFFPRLGWPRYEIARSGALMNWAALLAWAAGIVCAISLYAFGLLHEFFLAGPVWLLTAVLYLILSKLLSRNATRPGLEMIDSREASPGPSQDHDRYGEVSPRPERDALDADGRRTTNRTWLWLYGGAAMGSFVVCLGLPIWMFVTSSGPSDSREFYFKNALFVASIVHLTTAFAAVMQFEKTPRNVN